MGGGGEDAVQEVEGVRMVRMQFRGWSASLAHMKRGFNPHYCMNTTGWMNSSGGGRGRVINSKLFQVRGEAFVGPLQLGAWERRLASHLLSRCKD